MPVEQPQAQPGGVAGGPQPPPQQQRQTPQQQNPLLNVRDRLFEALFYRMTITYARAFPFPIRKAFEYMILAKV